jgi:hypothetical protein
VSSEFHSGYCCLMVRMTGAVVRIADSVSSSRLSPCCSWLGPNSANERVIVILLGKRSAPRSDANFQNRV